MKIFNTRFRCSPSDTEGRPIPLDFDAWVAYARSHVFLEHISCFCVVTTGEHCSVKLVRPRDRSKDTFHLGCFHWDRNGGGCQYFCKSEQSFYLQYVIVLSPYAIIVDIKACFQDRLYMQETELYVRKPLDTSKYFNYINFCCSLMYLIKTLSCILRTPSRSLTCRLHLRQ